MGDKEAGIRTITEKNFNSRTGRKGGRRCYEYEEGRGERKAKKIKGSKSD